MRPIYRTFIFYKSDKVKMPISGRYLKDHRGRAEATKKRRFETCLLLLFSPHIWMRGGRGKNAPFLIKRLSNFILFWPENGIKIKVGFLQLLANRKNRRPLCMTAASKPAFYSEHFSCFHSIKTATTKKVLQSKESARFHTQVVFSSMRSCSHKQHFVESIF